MNEAVIRDVATKVAEVFEALSSLNADDLSEVKRLSKQTVGLRDTGGFNTGVHMLRRKDIREQHAKLMAAGVLLLLVFMRRARTNGNLLKLVTCAVQKTSPAVQERVKRQIEREVTNGGPFKPRDKAALAHFTRENGTFADQKPEPSVQPCRGGKRACPRMSTSAGSAGTDSRRSSACPLSASGNAPVAAGRRWCV